MSALCNAVPRYFARPVGVWVSCRMLYTAMHFKGWVPAVFFEPCDAPWRTGFAAK